MSFQESEICVATPIYGKPISAKERRNILLPAWSREYDGLPVFDDASGLWLLGNLKLFRAKLAHIEAACGPNSHTGAQLDAIDAEAERLVLDSKVLVCGIHSRAHMRAAVVPVRWGSPRIVVMSGGFRYHLGEDLNEEPFKAARLWRYCWDPITDLAVSRRAPEKLPTYACHNPTVDRLIAKIAGRQLAGIDSPSQTDLVLA